MFDPWLVCTNRIAVSIAANLAVSWDQVEPARKRKMKPTERENLAAILQALTANFAYAAALGSWPPSFGVSLRSEKQPVTRYDRPGFKGVPRVVRTLADANVGLLQLEKSHTKGAASIVTAGPNFLTDYRTLKAFGLSAQKFGQSVDRESIFLVRKSEDSAFDAEERELINYTETDATRRYRLEMLRINNFLSHADIQLAEHGPEKVITSIRFLRRVFNLPSTADDEAQGFEYGGRLFGGWWQNLHRSQRQHIRIAAEPVADLDFSAAFLRLAYAHVGLPAPEGDLYATIPGLSDPRWRPGVKKAVLAMLFRHTPLTRVPRGSRGELPPGIAGPQLRAAILAAHPALAPIFETGIGMKLMFTESRILVEVLLALEDAGIPALPMHDGLMCARTKADRAASVMGEVAEAAIGYRLPISLKSLY